MSKAGKFPPFPLLLPFRQKLQATFVVEDGRLTVEPARASVRLHADPNIVEALTSRPRSAFKLSVRAVGKLDDLSANWHWNVDRGSKPGQPPVLELGCAKFGFETNSRGATASPEYKLYRAFIDGDWLGVKLSFGKEPRDFVYTELTIALVRRSGC